MPYPFFNPSYLLMTCDGVMSSSETSAQAVPSISAQTVPDWPSGSGFLSKSSGLKLPSGQYHPPSTNLGRLDLFMEHTG